MSCSFKVGLS